MSRWADAAADPRVAVFLAVYLPRSQTFIDEELRRHRRYVPEVFARSRQNADAFHHQPVHVGGPVYGATAISPAFDRRFRNPGFALVHAHFGTTATYAWPYASRHDLPFVVSFHGYDAGLLTARRRASPRHWPYLAVSRRMLRRATLVLCASDELAEIVGNAGARPGRVAVHPLGIDVSRFSPQPRDPSRFAVAMVGRLVAKKGFDIGLRALALLRRGGVTPDVVVIGDGPLRQQLEDLTRALDLDDVVSFRGEQPYDEVVHVLERSHVLLAPSVVTDRGDRDSGLMVVKEAAAAGAVPVGSRHGGLPEIIRDSQTGYLVPEHDVAAIADRLQRLASDPSLRRRLADAAAADVASRFDSTARAEALDAFYDRAMALHREDG